MRTLAMAVVVALTVAGDASAADARGGWFSVTLPVIAVVHDELYAGEAIGHLDRTGTIEIRSTQNANSKCAGEFHYTDMSNGVATMRCDGGGETDLAFKALGMMSGYGHGSTPRGETSFTFGLDPDEALPYLRLPPGSKLVKTDSGLRLVSR